MNLILLGAPGSGKGTQSVFLHDALHIPSISTGNILREAARKKTSLGEIASRYTSKGQLVPDEVVIDLVEERISRPDCQNGYILDGFPRTLNQAEELTRILCQKNQQIYAVIDLEVPEEELLKRLTGRRMCSHCGAGYHMLFSPPAQDNTCDRCGGDLYQRDDDKEETIQRRLKVYKEQTAPLIDYYEQAGLLKQVCGTGEAKEIFRHILKEVQA